MGRASSVWQRLCEFLSFCNILFQTFVLICLRQSLSSQWLWSNFEIKNKRFARSLSLSRNATPIPRQDDFKRAKRKVWCCSLPSSYIFMLLKIRVSKSVKTYLIIKRTENMSVIEGDIGIFGFAVLAIF